jgi:translation initiation factor 3 subunit M
MDSFRETSYQFLLYYLRVLPPSSQAYSSSALEAIATALRLPSVFDFDPLFKLEAVISVQGDALFSLLQIFMNKGVDDFVSWESSHPDVLGKSGKYHPQHPPFFIIFSFITA